MLLGQLPCCPRRRLSSPFGLVGPLRRGLTHLTSACTIAVWLTPHITHRVPIYAISSLISLYSLAASFYIDAVRDLYESFVIYCFFSLLVEYL